MSAVDVSEDGVRWAKEQGFDAHAVDAQSPDAVAGLGLEQADVVIAGEVIEHLDAPGPFLQAMTALVGPDGLLVITTPNAYRLLNFLAPASGRELIHPDHTAWHSPHTLRNLLERNGWHVEGAAYYRNPAGSAGGCEGGRFSQWDPGPPRARRAPRALLERRPRRVGKTSDQKEGR